VTQAISGARVVRRCRCERHGKQASHLTAGPCRRPRNRRRHWLLVAASQRDARLLGSTSTSVSRQLLYAKFCPSDATLKCDVRNFKSRYGFRQLKYRHQPGMLVDFCATRSTGATFRSIDIKHELKAPTEAQRRCQSGSHWPSLVSTDRHTLSRPCRERHGGHSNFARPTKPINEHKIRARECGSALSNRFGPTRSRVEIEWVERRMLRAAIEPKACPRAFNGLANQEMPRRVSDDSLRALSQARSSR
jgi:hypothetical protein